MFGNVKLPLLIKIFLHYKGCKYYVVPRLAILSEKKISRKDKTLLR